MSNVQQAYKKLKKNDKSGIKELNNELKGRVCKFDNKYFIILNVHYVELSKPTDKGFEFIPEIGFSLKPIKSFWEKDIIVFHYPNSLGFGYDFKKVEVLDEDFFEYNNTTIDVNDTVLYIENELRLNSDIQYGIIEYINEKYLVKSKYDKEPKLKLLDKDKIFMKEL